LIDHCIEGIDIQKQVNTCLGEGLHTAIMIASGINVVRFGQSGASERGYFELR
jgi:hypothetical protein